MGIALDAECFSQHVAACSVPTERFNSEDKVSISSDFVMCSQFFMNAIDNVLDISLIKQTIASDRLVFFSKISCSVQLMLMYTFLFVFSANKLLY